MRTVVMILIMLLVWAVQSPAADSGIREGAREVGKGIREGAKEVGQGA